MLGGIVLIGAIAYAWVVSPTKAPSDFPPPAAPVEEEEETERPEGLARYEIASGSTVTFELNEILRGEPTNVVGVSDAVSGGLLFTPDDVSATRFDTLYVNARTFVTDTEQRNNAIRRLILKTEDDANEFIVLRDIRVEAAPEEPVVPGQPFTFTMAGPLTISGVTHDTGFDVTAVLTDDGTLEGTATTTLFYEEFGLFIPDFPFLANVEKELDVRIDFVAAPQS